MICLQRLKDAEKLVDASALKRLVVINICIFVGWGTSPMVARSTRKRRRGEIIDYNQRGSIGSSEQRVE